jgi:hypothetical protein
LTALAAWGVPAMAEPANDYLLILDSRAGPYRYWDSFKKGKPDAYSAALAAFGTPSRFRAEGNLCRVTWRSVGITIGFASQLRPCATQNLFNSAWYGLTLFGRRWHNRFGIRVGMTVAEVRKRYPSADFDSPLRRPWLVLLWKRDHEFRFIHLAVAVDRSGKVTSIEVPATYIY